MKGDQELGVGNWGLGCNSFYICNEATNFSDNENSKVVSKK